MRLKSLLSETGGYTMKLRNIIEEKEIDIHREYEPGEFFWNPSGIDKGMLLLILYPYTAARGVKKWTGVEFQMKPNY